jgi:hypothetical protein
MPRYKRYDVMRMLYANIPNGPGTWPAAHAPMANKGDAGHYDRQGTPHAGELMRRARGRVTDDGRKPAGVPRQVAAVDHKWSERTSKRFPIG